jgi:ribonuclease E
VKLEPIKVEPPEVINVEMSAQEQDTYAEMGISPLLKLDREGKSTRSVIINVVQPGELPPESILSSLEPIISEKTTPDIVSITPATPTFSLEPESSFPPLTMFPELTIVTQETEPEKTTETEIDTNSSSASVPNRRRRRRSSALDGDGLSQD